MEASDGSWRILGFTLRHFIFDWHVGVGESRSVGAALRGALAAREGPGAGYVSGAVVLSRLRDSDGRREPGNETKNGCRINWPGLRVDHGSVGRGYSRLPEAGFLGRCRCSRFPDSEHPILVVL